MTTTSCLNTDQKIRNLMLYWISIKTEDEPYITINFNGQICIKGYPYAGVIKNKFWFGIPWEEEINYNISPKELLTKLKENIY